MLVSDANIGVTDNTALELVADPTEFVTTA
jgi:hypothetical protein